MRVEFLASALALVLTSCGSGDGGGAATQPSLNETARPLEVPAGVDAAAVLASACTGWALPRDYDNPHLVEPVVDLVSEGHQRPVDGDLVREGLVEACADAGGDPQRFVDTALERLGLSRADLDARVDAACRRYQSRPADQEGRHALNDQLRGRLREAGLEADDILVAVNTVCAEQFAEPLPIPPRIEPNLSLTPGDSSAPGDLATWCAEGYAATLGEPDEAARQAVLDAYSIAEAERADYRVMRLVPAELGGTNEAANLFPVALDAHPGADGKVEVDRLLAEMVCGGQVSLDEARRNIISRWPSAVAASRGPGQPVPAPTTSPTSGACPTCVPTSTRQGPG